MNSEVVNIVSNSERQKYYFIDTRTNSIDIDHIRSVKPETIVIHRYHECRYYEILNQTLHLEDIIDLAHEMNSKIILTTGSARFNHLHQWALEHPHGKTYHKVFDNMDRYNIVTLQFWQTECWAKFMFHLNEIPNLQNKSNSQIIKEYNEDFYYLFITLNNVVKNNRCMQMDQLAKYDLIERGIYSWQSWDQIYGRDILNSNRYDFRYWKPEIKILDQFPKKINVNNIYDPGAPNGFTLPPQELKKSFMQIVSETHYTEIAYTEKTAAPLFFGKLFLVNGARHFHKSLENLGFKLYTEIFDYSFDDEFDLEKRTDMLTHNVFRLRNKTPSELRSMYNEVLPKIEYNKKHLKQMVLSLQEIPNLYTEIWNDYKFEDWAKTIDEIYQAKNREGSINE